MIILTRWLGLFIFVPNLGRNNPVFLCSLTADITLMQLNAPFVMFSIRIRPVFVSVCCPVCAYLWGVKTCWMMNQVCVLVLQTGSLTAVFACASVYVILYRHNVCVPQYVKVVCVFSPLCVCVCGQVGVELQRVNSGAPVRHCWLLEIPHNATLSPSWSRQRALI